jgi:hypothetical protein
VLIRVETARQRWLLARVDEQISAISQDRRRAGHPEPPGVILCRHNLSRYLDVGPDREQWSQPTIQGFRARAVRHVQNLKSHLTAQNATRRAGQGTCEHLRGR